MPAPRLAIAAVALTLGACAYLPNTGPSRQDVIDQAQASPAAPGGLKFAVVGVDAQTATAVTAADDAPGFAATFGDAELREPVLGVGDSVAITVLEAGAEPLFANAQGTGSRAVTLPEQTLGLDGTLSVPFAGRIAAAGLTTAALQAAIEKKLTGRAAQPQVLVTAGHGGSGSVTVLGEVGAGARLPLTARGERVLDALAASGGLRGTVHETVIELDRDGRTLRLPLARLFADPQENVRLRPGDTLLVLRRPQTFTVFGATGRSAQVDFGSERVSLGEAVARAGGLDDSRADPRGVFLFRYESAATARKLGLDALVTDDGAPVVYRLDLMQAGAYFVSQRFAVHDHDVLYVAGAPANELQKFLQLLGLVTQPVLSGVVLKNSSE